MNNFQLTLDRAAKELLPICVAVYLFLIVVGIGFQILVLTLDGARVMVGYSLLCLFIGLSVRVNIEHDLIQRNAERVVVAFLILMAGSVLLFSHFSGDVNQTTNLIFVLTVAGYVLAKAGHYYFIIAVTCCSWLLTILNSSELNVASAFSVLQLFLGVTLSYLLHTMRLSQLEQLSEMQVALDDVATSREQVLANQAVMRSMLDNLPAGIVVRDNDTRVIYVNADARRQLGYDSRNIIGQPLSEANRVLVDADGNEILPADYPFVRAHESGKPVINEVVGIVHEHKETTWGLVSAFPVQLGGDQGTVTTLAIVDITEQKTAQLRLRESETRDSVILNSVTEAVIAVDESNRITLFNPFAERLTGITVGSALGQKFSEVVQYAEDEVASARAEELNIKQGVVTSASGEKISVELLVSEVFNSEEHRGWVYTFRDVREQLKLEQERAMLDKMSSVGVLAAGIAHDFNNLLTAIYGNVALAESVLPADEKARAYLRRGSESIELATNLTKQLLTFSRGSEPVRRLIDLETLVRDAAQFAVSGSAIIVDIDVTPTDYGVEADAVQLQQAIGNIVLNANQAMEGSGTIKIWILLDSADEQVPELIITIKDDGPGMEPELLPKIFDLYFTTRSDGTGLGLATAHSIITKHGGSVQAESVLGSGSTFTIRLPAVSKHSAFCETLALPTGEDELLRILVMDDDDIVRETICRLLEQFGHEVVEACNGEEAIERYQTWNDNEERFDFVIMDLTIAGGMGGMAAAQEILAIDPDAKLVVTSGYSEGAEMARYDELGFVARLEKPFRTSELQAMIAEVVQA